MITIPSGINTEKEKAISRPRILLEIVTGTGTSYFSTEKFSHNGNAYEGKLLALGDWSRGISIPEDQVQRIITIEPQISDIDRGIRNAVSVGDPVSVKRIFLDVAYEEVLLFHGTISGIAHKSGITRITVKRELDILDQEIPSKRLNETDYPNVDPALYGKVIPAVFGARRIPLMALKFTSEVKADANWNITVTYTADFLVSAGHITSAVLLQDGVAVDPGLYSVSLDGPNNPVYPGLATINFTGNALRPDGTLSEFQADVTGIIGVSTQEEYLLELWTNTFFGLGRDISDFDAGDLAVWALDLADLGLQASANLDTPLKFSTIRNDVMFATRSHWGEDENGKIVIQMDVAQNSPVYSFADGDIIVESMEEWEPDHTDLIHSASISWPTTEITDPASARFFAANPALAAENYGAMVSWAYPDPVPMSRDDVQFSTFCMADYEKCGNLLQYLIKLSCESIKRCRFETTLKGLAITEMDRVDITFSLYGWTALPWIVEEVQHIEDGRIRLTCREYVASIYLPDTVFYDPGSDADPGNLFPPDPPIWGYPDLSLSGHINSDGTYIRDVSVLFNLATGSNNVGITGVQIWISYDGITFTQYGTVTSESSKIQNVSQGLTLYVKLIAQKGPDLLSVDSDIRSIAIGSKTTPPSDVTNFTAARQDYGVVFTWGAILDADVAGYEIRMGADWWTAQVVVSSLQATSYLYKSMPAGTQTFLIRAIDTSGNYSANNAQTQLTIQAPGQPAVALQFLGDSAVLTWNNPTTDFTVTDYEIRYGAITDTWASALPEGNVMATTYKSKVAWGGTRRFFVRAVDSAGNPGNPGIADVVIVAPGKPINFLPEVIDNNVLLRWVGVAGALPIAFFEVRKGDVFDTAAVFAQITGTFATKYETVAGTYKYWVVGVDTAGNYGTPESLSASVSQSPDYILHQDWASDFSGTKTNIVIDPDSGHLIGPVNATESWESHFTSHGWTSPQDQVNAGYLYYMEPALTSATYEEKFDYGTLLAGTQITVDLDKQNIDGAVTVTCDIAVSADDISYTTYADTWQVFATNFRYVKVTLHFSGTDKDLVEVNHLNVKLSIRQMSDAGNGYASSSDPTGTPVYFNKAFMDVMSIVVTPQGTAARIPVYDFVDVPNPTTFSVYLFDSNGNRVSGAFSWNAQGY